MDIGTQGEARVAVAEPLLHLLDVAAGVEEEEARVWRKVWKLTVERLRICGSDSSSFALISTSMQRATAMAADASTRR
jgi:hypothetical protein